MQNATPADGPLLMEAAALGPLHAALWRAGYRVIGPTVRDGAIVLGELDSADDLPFGWGVSLQPGGYRIRRSDDGAAFGHSAGPQSWKQFLHPPREKVWSARPTAGGFEVEPADEPAAGLAFFGVRPCDLSAIKIQDQVLGRGQHAGSPYAVRRSGVFIVAVNCTEPGETCFCASMGTGPEAGPGYDLALTEMTGEGAHQFLVEVGSPAGADVIASADPAGRRGGRAAGAVGGGRSGGPDGPVDAGRHPARPDGSQRRCGPLG